MRVLAIRSRSTVFLPLLTLGAAVALVGCGETAPVPVEPGGGNGPGTLDITTATIGTGLDPDGYSLTVDGGAGQAIGLDDHVTLTDLAPGTHQLQLSAVAANCNVTSSNPRSVTVNAGATARTTFGVICAAYGSVTLTVTTVGDDTDPDGFLLSVDGATPQRLGVSETVVLSDLLPGTHLIEVGDLAPPCAVAGGNPVRLYVLSGAMVDVAFSVICQGPLHGRLAFTSTDPSGNLDIYIVRPDGTGLIRLTDDPAADRNPAVSPDGAHIAFQSDRGGNDEIYVMNANGSGLAPLTAWPLTDSRPVWSPDGTRIVFERVVPKYALDGTYLGLYLDVFVTEADGSFTNLTDYAAQDGSPVVSPDGTMIAFTSTRVFLGDVFVMNLDGSGLLRLTSNFGWFPAWSPDGTRIAFVDAQGLSVMNADGSNPVSILANPDAHDPSWSPDGTRIVFNDGTTVYVMNADGTGLVTLSRGPLDSNGPQAWSP